jgi:hypothetical protein
VPREGYLRQDMALGELLLARTPRGLAFVRQDADGRRALDLEHLAAAVDCVPDARAELDAVKSLQTTGTVMKWIGWAAFLSGTALVVGLRREGRPSLHPPWGPRWRGAVGP